MKTTPSTSARAFGPCADPRTPKRLTIWSLRGCALLVAACCAPLISRGHAADAVLTWNEIMQQTVTGNANLQGRSAAIVQLSVFEAVNSIIGDYDPYLGTIVAPAGASPEAAAVAAAYRALGTLYP